MCVLEKCSMEDWIMFRYQDNVTMINHDKMKISEGWGGGWGVGFVGVGVVAGNGKAACPACPLTNLQLVTYCAVVNFGMSIWKSAKWYSFPGVSFWLFVQIVFLHAR